MLNNAVDAAEIQRVVVDTLREVIEDPEMADAPITPAARLSVDLGLKSIDLAQLVAILEMELEADPFRELVPITSIRTVGDLRDAYVRFLSGERTDSDADQELDRARTRAAARRR